jgi:hypothetical protein
LLLAVLARIVLTRLVGNGRLLSRAGIAHPTSTTEIIAKSIPLARLPEPAQHSTIGAGRM